LLRGPLKQQTLAVLHQRQVPVATVIDVGVLDGTPELLEAYPDRMHLLFEPVAEFAPLIERRYAHVPHRLVQAAVSDSSGQTSLQVRSMLGGTSVSHSFMVDQPDADSRIVAKVSLDDWLRDAGIAGPYLLKVDVDGFEMRVLRGAKETLKNTSIVIVEATADDLIERVSFVQEAGFKLFDLTEPCYYDDSFWQCDAVLIRRDLHAQYFETIGATVDLAKYTVFRA
jgi:FkbM family methyltransferase